MEAVKFFKKNPSKDSFHKSFFIVAASNLIRTGEVYRVTVFCSEFKKEETLELQLKISNENFCSSTKSKVLLNGTKSQIVDFKLNDIPEGSCVLHVKCGKVDENISLSINYKKNSAIIQTDKAIYKPSDKVQFRVIIIDADTRPVEAENVQVFITDGEENRVKQYENVGFKKGVYQDELQLSDLPVMGNWKIHVKFQTGEETVKVFEVSEYVLPQFEVSIDTNRDIDYNHEKIHATIKANYTFGKVAKGTATVLAEVNSAFGSYKKLSRTIQVDGKASFDVDLFRDLNLKNPGVDRVIKLNVTFKEELSGKEAKASAEVQVHKAVYKLDLIKSNEKFKPGLPYHITAIIKKYNKNAPVSDKLNPVRFNLVFYYDVKRTFKEPYESELGHRRIRANEEYEAYEEVTDSKEFQVFPQNGMAKLDIDLDKKYTRFNVTAKYMDTDKSLLNIKKAVTECNQYIMARVLTPNPTLNKNVEIEVLFTDEMNFFTYQIFGRGVLVKSETLQIPLTNRHIFDFKPSIKMIPKAQMVVYYITTDGEIISDRLEIQFGNELENEIELKLASDQVLPGKNMDIEITTKPNSFVGLLGVDQSVLLLKKGNDIDASSLFQELTKYANADKKTYSYIPSDERYHDFYESSIVIVTNAKRPYEPKIQRRARRYYREERYFFSSRSSRSMDNDFCLRNVVPRPEISLRLGEPELELNDDEDDDDMEMMDSDEIKTIPKKEIEIRKEFPETWLFDNFQFERGQTKKVFSKKVPDTITSWVITGFSLDPITGLGLTKQPSKFSVFQPFFVSANLPYSIKRGEVVSIPIIIFNYMNTDQTTDVTLFNEDYEFDFINKNNLPYGVKIEKVTKQVTVKANDGVTVNFEFKALKVGNIKLKVVAETMTAGDGVEKLLKVEPEGITQFMNDAIFIDLRTKSDFSRIFDIEIPQNVVADSTHIEVSAIGDVLGPSIDNLDKLIKLPYGCGEQNMLNFVPNIVILGYLTAVHKLTVPIEQKTKKYMETGYQRELTYRHNDGSYSAFGKYDNTGSTWLTAFVAKSFHQASKYIHIENKFIREALEFLKNVQEKDGSFPEIGKVFHSDMQGGSSNGIALTAYTLITFLENEKYRDHYYLTIEKAIDFILTNKNKLTDSYSVAIAAYAMYLANHDEKEFFLEKLDERAEKADGMMYWTKDSSNDYFKRSKNAINIEMTSYALLTYIEAGRELEGISIMKWLVTQRNENGGFQSTQDTVVGLQSLAKLASNIYDPDCDVKISVVPKSSPTIDINVNNSNSMILQKVDLSSGDRHFEVSANGKGFCIFQISYRYNIDDSAKGPRFSLSPVIEKSSNKEFLHLSVGTNFIADQQTDKSNMAVMEITLPSGFIFDSDYIPELLKMPRVKKVETKDGDTVVVVYFDDIDTKEIRPQIKAYRKHKVAKQKPVPVVIYDYYDNSRRATTFYSPPEIAIGDITEY